MNDDNKTPIDVEEEEMIDADETSDDVVIEQDGNEELNGDEDGAPKDATAKLREKLRKAIEEKQQYLDGWQRDKAEFVNARKRDEEDKRNLLKFAEANLISELIPALDAFDMAMGNKEAWEKADKNWRTGVEYIYSQISTTLQNHGLTKIDPKGQAFDPMHHHSVALVEVDDKSLEGKVVEVMATGYSLNGKVIREPQVKVGEHKS
jgi:molecular chaperone GrpE